VTGSKRNLWVTFDLWGTLFIDRPELDDTRNRMRCERMCQVLSESGIRVSEEDMKSGYEQTATQLQAIWRTNRELLTLEQIRLIMNAAGLRDVVLDSGTATRLERAYVDPIFEAPPELNGDTVTTLQEMRSRVRGIGLISNTGRSPGTALHELLRKYGVLGFFDSTVFSDQVSSRKPDRQIFERAVAALGAEPAKVVHIGDDPEADTWGAKKAGMKALLFDYPIPEGYKSRPNSLFALSRFDRRVADSEIKPDGRISSLREALGFIDAQN
jgi:putative hydrolase of the HAD superfamily